MSEHYTLTLSREQAVVLSRACDFYGRIRNGQLSEITWELLLRPHEKSVAFDRELVDTILCAARRPIFPELSANVGHHYGVTQDKTADVAWDIHEVVRNAIAYHDSPQGGMTVDFKDPMCWSGDPLPTITVKEEE